MRPIRLHDTMSRSLRELEPRDPGKVGIYWCGPTVYDRVHVGNGRPFVVYAQLKRFLEHEGYDVTLVSNITDINDKIYDAANATGRGSEELAAEMAAHYIADTDRLGLGRPDVEPFASGTIGPIVALIAALVDSGHAYEAGRDVYFRVRSQPDYGRLSHRDPDQMDQGEGVEGAGRKEDPLDFALWKGAKPDEDTAWDSPWGRGRPGWHIECSAMAEEALGLGFDIHGGGNDLVFPHHVNAVAQTEAARGEPLARIWMHNGMLQIGGDEKMSKSLGNVRSLADVLDRVEPEVFLLYLSSGHYRQPIAFSGERLEQAEGGVRRIREAARRLMAGPSPEVLAEHREAFFDALADDFNTARALAALFTWVSEANKLEDAPGDQDLREMLSVLGIESLLARGESAPPEAFALADRRAAARAARAWAEADRLRDELRALGWEVRDGPQGQELIAAG
ncbi:MAG: cysteinyl-tRNA synthetase [Solirubrobacteraceae bacterium]|nr:cysteinyl-tRNA synthetase [Solirubrobacteraceae bacterium]